MPRDLKRIAAAIVLLAFTPFASAGDCVKVGSRCVDSTPCKNISGVNVCLSGVALPAGALSVPDTCWDYEDTYNCVSPQQIDDCQPLRDRGCGQTGSNCVSTNASTGTCTNYQQTYQCQTSPAQTQTVEDCGAKEFCMDGKCFDTGHAPDQDIFKVATAMEAAREAGLYMDPNSLEMFKGYGSHCAKGYFGLKNCCKTSGNGAGMSNAGVVGQMAQQGASNGAGYVSAAASPYVYDTMFSSDNSWLMGKAIDAWSSNAWSPSFNPSLSFYGMTWTTAATVPEAMIGTNVGIGAAGETMGGTLYFNPTTFYIAVAIMVVQELMACEPQDQVLGTKRGQNLCHFAGSYCSNKMPVLGTCLETTESYCCFNSRLARIINEQGRPQIGKSWGSGESPNCSGFTPDQFQGLDFSKMDLSEFYAEIMSNMKTPDVDAAAQKAQDTVTNKLNYYYAH